MESNNRPLLSSTSLFGVLAAIAMVVAVAAILRSSDNAHAAPPEAAAKAETVDTATESSQAEAPAEAKPEGPEFERVYEEYRFFGTKEDALKAIDAYLFKHNSPVVESMKLDLQMHGISSDTEQLLEEQPVDIKQLEAKVEQLKELYLQVGKITDAHSEYAVAWELKGSAATWVFSGQFNLLKAKAQAGEEYETLLNEIKNNPDGNGKAAYKKCLELDDSRSRAHVSLAYRISGEAQGMANPQVFDHALTAIEKAPGDPAPEGLLVDLFMSQSRAFTPEQKERLAKALPNTEGRLRSELLDHSKRMKSYVHQAKYASESMAAAGFDQGLDEEVFQMQDAATLIDELLGTK